MFARMARKVRALSSLLPVQRRMQTVTLEQPMELSTAIPLRILASSPAAILAETVLSHFNCASDDNNTIAVVAGISVRTGLAHFCSDDGAKLA